MSLRRQRTPLMKYAEVSPRRCLAESSPITQRTASMTFDLPQPLGPTTPVRLLGKVICVGSTKDLKPASLILVSRIVLSSAPGRPGGWCSVEEYAPQAHNAARDVRQPRYRS